jgi:predicted GTPase
MWSEGEAAAAGDGAEAALVVVVDVTGGEDGVDAVLAEHRADMAGENLSNADVRILIVDQNRNSHVV